MPLPKKAVKKKRTDREIFFNETIQDNKVYVSPNQMKHIIPLSPKQQKKTKKGFTHSQK